MRPDSEIVAEARRRVKRQGKITEIRLAPIEVISQDFLKIMNTYRDVMRDYCDVIYYPEETYEKIKKMDQ